MATAIFSPYKANDGGVAYHRDVSFSSYLDSNEREFVRSLAESINSPSPAREILIPRKNARRNVSRATKRNSELEVFGADRYFNEKIKDNYPLSRMDGDDGSTRHRHHRRDNYRRDDGLLERKSSRSNTTTSSSSSHKSPTPSLRSQGSFNNQIGMLLPKKGFVGHKIFSGFQCKGTCFDKKSVHTFNPHQMVQSSPKTYQRNEYEHTKDRVSHKKHFAFPIIDTATLSLDHDSKFPSKSMDVFGFHNLEKQDVVAQNFDTKFSILAWDAIPNSSPINTPFPFPLRNKTSPCNVRDEDVCSDASSDLFEIENLSRILDVQTSNPNNEHESSEGSIEWSIVTASAADNSSIATDDYEDDHKTSITIERRRINKSSTSSGNFLGCTNHKAVDVVGNY